VRGVYAYAYFFGCDALHSLYAVCTLWYAVSKLFRFHAMAWVPHSANGPCGSGNWKLMRSIGR
jgi:hypothetical protein